MEYVKNCWYVAGWSDRFARDLTGVRILEQDIVLYRTEAGGLVALRNQCPHKLLPLSKGRLVGDAVQCGYHGMTFAPDGNCVRIPGQDAVPRAACVRSYPVHEKHGVAWIWMGEAELADPEKIFDMPELSDPSWALQHGEDLHIASNYLNVAENLCDPAHVSFVHPTTLGNPESEDVPVEMEREGDVVITSRWIRDAPPIGFFQNYGGFSGHVDRWHYYHLHTPNIAVIDFGSIETEKNADYAERVNGVQIYAFHFLTPVDATNTVDWWMHLRNRAVDDPAVGERMNEMFKMAFDEDKEILEAIQLEELKPRDQRPIRLKLDRGTAMYRKVVDGMIAAERSESSPQRNKLNVA